MSEKMPVELFWKYADYSYVAVDSNGRQYGYDKCPEIHGNRWEADRFHLIEEFRLDLGDDWTKSLCKRPIELAPCKQCGRVPVCEKAYSGGSYHRCNALCWTGPVVLTPELSAESWNAVMGVK